MRSRITILLLITSVMMLTVATVQAQPPRPIAAVNQARSLYVMGDSWSLMLANYQTIEQEFDQRGLSRITVYHYGQGGSSTRKWLRDDPCSDGCPGYFTELKTTIANDPTSAPVVFINLGAIDLISRYRIGPGLGDAVFDEIETNLQAIVSQLLATRPDVTVILPSYEILNYERSTFCTLRALLLFGETEPEPVNQLGALAYFRQVQVANRFSRAVAVNVAGTLQGHPGGPDLTAWSPAEFISDDCHHLTEDGYVLYIDAIVDTLIAPDGQWPAFVE